MKFLQFLKKKYKYIIVLFIILPFLYLFVLARSAAWVFNRAMAEQKMFNGTVTVEKIYGSISGKTDFEGLRWQNEMGETILYIPEGTIGVKPLDILQGKFETETLYRIRLKNAKIRLGLDDNMTPDFLPKREDRRVKPRDFATEEIMAAGTEEERVKASEKWRKKREEALKHQIKNFNYSDRDFDIGFLLEDCVVEIFHRGKHYILNSVNVDSRIKTGDYLKYKVQVSQFSGSMTGGNINLRGTVDLSTEEPTIDASGLFQDINPELLGLLDNFNNYMTLDIYFSGPLISPIGDGTIRMQKLDIPNLPFSDVIGKFQYKDSVFNFTSLTAKIWDGEVDLTGYYNIDTRYYHIDGVAKNLSAKEALPKDSLRTSVDANLHLIANENSKNLKLWGDFVSTSGSYMQIPFDKVSARFTNAYHDLRFYDAKIDIGYYEVSSDFIGVKDGKLTLDPVVLTNMNTGNVRMRYVHKS
ncbi:MAG: hypothetical protein J6M62_02680 [Selenomonadaceae bacterium]|nr:hypothetical protein [Selenomonadaceae bacterium]